jgi:hypothetical protein
VVYLGASVDVIAVIATLPGPVGSSAMIATPAAIFVLQAIPVHLELSIAPVKEGYALYPPGVRIAGYGKTGNRRIYVYCRQRQSFMRCPCGQTVYWECNIFICSELTQEPVNGANKATTSYSLCYWTLFLPVFLLQTLINYIYLVTAKYYLRRKRELYATEGELRKSFIHLFIHSFHSMPDDMSITSSKVSSARSAIQYFLFQFPVSSRFIKIIQYLITSSFLSFLHFYLCLSFNSLF